MAAGVAMPGPVLVLDAAGRPLMPLAAAHARKLLDGGRAYRFPHPALTIIRLEHSVDQPVLRPVLAEVVVHTTTAELFLLAAGPRATFPLLYVVLDRVATQRSRNLHRRQAMTLSTDHLAPIVSVLDSLRRFLPISHIAIIQPSYKVRNGLRSWVQRVGIQEIVPHAVGAASDTPLQLHATLTDFVADPRRAAQALVALPRLCRQRNRLFRTAPPTIGVVEELGLTGILDESATMNRELPVLRVAIAADREGISWKSFAIPANMSVQHWTGRGVALVPVVQIPNAALPFLLY